MSLEEITNEEYDEVRKMGWKGALFYADGHFGHEYQKGLNVLYKYMKDKKNYITHVIDLGDVVDNTAMSDFPVPPEDKLTAQEQFDLYARHQKKVDDIVPSAMKYIVAGNHDKARLDNKRNLNRGLASLRNLQFENILKESLKEQGIDIRKYEFVDGAYDIPLTKNNVVTVFHGDPRLTPYLKGGVTGTRRTAEMYPNNNWLIQGHEHWYKEIPRMYEGKSMIVLDCLADVDYLKNAYLNYHPYSNGFGIMHYNKKRDKAVWQHIPIKGGEAIVDGRAYKG